MSMVYNTSSALPTPIFLNLNYKQKSPLCTMKECKKESQNQMDKRW